MNRLFKTIICTLIIFAIAVPFVGINTFAADSTDNKVEEARDMLEALGFIPEYDDYSLNLAESVTRAELASLVGNLIRCSEYTGETGYYYDVPTAHWSYNSISALTAAGILSGGGDKLFRPDDMILKEEAYKIFSVITGYQLYAESNGGYPYGYTMAAKKSGLSNGVSSSASVTRGDMFILAYNALTINIYDQVVFGENKTYEVSENETLLSIYHNIYPKQGFASGTDGVSVNGGRVPENGQLKIDDEVYDVDGDFSEYIGDEVRFLVQKESRDDTGRII